jgi:hypothetical protein
MTIVGCADDPLPPTEVRRQVATNLSDLLLAQAIAALPTRFAASKLPAADDVSTQLFGDDQFQGDGIYEVTPSALCAFIAPGQASACAALVGRLDLRLHTTPIANAANVDPADEGLAIGVQIGTAHQEPITVSLATRRQPLGEFDVVLTTAVDFDALGRALAGLPGLLATQMSGHVTVTLTGSAFGVTLRTQVDRALAIGDPTDAFSLSSAPGFFQLDVFAAGNNFLSLALGLGETALALPAGTDGKRHGFAAHGLSGDVDLHLTPEDILSAINFSLAGPLVFTRDGAAARTFDLNPDDGRQFSFAFETEPALTFAPETKLDLRMTADHAVLGDPAPAFDVSQILLAGAVSATPAPDRIELDRGTFAITTVPAGHGFAASAGQCITDAVTTANPPFVQWSVGACN